MSVGTNLSFSTRLEIFVVSLIYVTGIYPPEVWLTSIYFFSGRNVGELSSFLLTLLGVSFLYTISMFFWADLFNKGLPGKFIFKIANKVLSKESISNNSLIYKIGKLVGNFQDVYKSKKQGFRSGMIRVFWMIIFGALPGGFTLFAILICASSRYFKGLVAILLGFSVSIYFTTIGGVYLVDRIHEFVGISVGVVLSILPFIVPVLNLFILTMIVIFGYLLHRYYRNC